MKFDGMKISNMVANKAEFAEKMLEQAKKEGADIDLLNAATGVLRASESLMNAIMSATGDISNGKPAILNLREPFVAHSLAAWSNATDVLDTYITQRCSEMALAAGLVTVSNTN